MLIEITTALIATAMLATAIGTTLLVRAEQPERRLHSAV